MGQILVNRLTKRYVVPVRDGGIRSAIKSLVRRKTRTVDAVTDISLRIDAGEVVGFLGPNGAGKTTTLKMLSGLLYPTSGEIKVLGHEPSRREKAYLRQMALIMGQRNQLEWDIPVVDSYRLNKAVFRIGDREFSSRLAELVDLLELGDLLQKPARNLSLGERMKCEFAGSLLHRPGVLFLDEPTIGLDVAMQRRIRSFVAEYNKRTGASVILTSHYMADVQALCKRVIIIHHGRLIFDGALTDLTRKFSVAKTIAVEFSEAGTVGAADVDAALGSLKSATEVEHTEVGCVLRVRNEHAAAVSARLLSELPIADLTIEEEQIDSVIEKAFLSTSDAVPPAGRFE